MSEYDGRCGSCGAFIRPYEDPKRGLLGECALMVYPPPVTARTTCPRYRPKGAPPPPPPRGKRASSSSPRAASSAAASVHKRLPTLPQEIDIDMDIGEFRRVLREVLSEELGLGDAELGGRWEGGEVILKPGKPGTQEKKIPLDAFFSKIVMIRDRLRVLEQKLNSNDKLTAAEKVELQSYITRCYGSLTTFNLLFANREDWFVGSGKEGDGGKDGD